jgi:hypothetical protein
MAKVKITGHASGTGILTVTAPNTSTDRTITLPDATGTLAITTDDDDKLPLAGGTLTGALQINSTLTTGASDTGYDVKFHGATAGCKFFWDESADHLRVEGKTDGSNIFTVTDNNADILNVTSSGLVINNDSGDRDFRVESDALTHALFVQGSDGRVGIGGTPTNMLSLFPTEQSSIRKIDFGLYDGGTDNTFVQTAYHASNGNVREIGLAGSIVNFYTGADSGTSTSNRLSITADGRGLSQFTAKVWIRLDMSNMSVPDSHNVSSVTDVSTGRGRINFANNFANSSYSMATTQPESYASGLSNQGTSSVDLYSYDTNGTKVDTDYTMAILFGD